jgi:hypothetical protein
MVAAGITLCLDMLHRTEFESEFVEHRNLVEKAIHLLGKYDDSTSALRGVKLLSSLLTEATSKQKPSKDRSHYNQNTRSRECEGDPPTWPESRHRIETLLAVDEPNSNANDTLSTAFTVVSKRADSNTNTTAGVPHVVGPSLVDDAIQPMSNSGYLNAYGSLNNANNNGLPSEISWTDLFSDCFPAQSGFENAFLIEDLLT